MKRAAGSTGEEAINRTVSIPTRETQLEGELKVSSGAEGVVLFSHGSGSSRHSPRNQYVAQTIREGGIGTLLFDLLTREEERQDDVTGALRFDIAFLAERLIAATNWLSLNGEVKDLNVGYFGSSTGGAAALVAAAQL